MFPKSSDYDYRKVFDDKDVSKLQTYFDTELLQVLTQITRGRARKDSTIIDNNKKLKLMMVCALLVNIMDHRKCFMQTLVGLGCYAQGLRDKGFKLLNALGVSCSIFHIRKHGNLWARLRSAISEINLQSFWWVTFDNLDFRMKFAKKLTVANGVGTLKRMLHLLTSQVTFRLDKQSNKSKVSTHESVVLNESHFKINCNCKHWISYSKTVFDNMHGDVIKGIKMDSSNRVPLLLKLQKGMPHWTSTPNDKVVYTTVDELYSGCVDDVGKFLVKLKRDLHIGEEGYPSYVVVGGDQQIYAHMKNLNIKYPGHYDWIYPVPGDWHILKTASEVIKYVLQNGGFGEFAKVCGHKGEISQWKDIHNIILALYESLLYESIQDFTAGHLSCEQNYERFWKQIEELTNTSTSEVCRFWSQMMIYIHAYIGFYFAVRSGNWELRNSSLRVLAELFFAYSRDKYELLVVNSISDSITYPKEILEYFLNGEWTVSVKGRPFHNQALDEAHETIINRKLKQITTRPSHFRMVNLADFIAYLDNECTGLDMCIPRKHKQKETDSQLVRTRAKLVHGIIECACIFSQKLQIQPLRNIFMDNSPALPPENIKDLLRIAEVGRERMFRYIRQYTLVPPTEIRQKRTRQRTRQKLKTFACKKETNKQLKTQLQQATTLLSSAYKTIVSCGKGQRTIQTHPLPLALCKPDGTMRAGCKSDFKDVMLELFPNSNTFTTTNTLTRDYEVIVDFLFQLHQPPPPDVLTYDSLAEYLWNKIVINLGVRRGANVLRIIVDKPRYLPKPRQLLHTSRSSKSGTMGESECQIIGEGEIPSAKEFQKLLANKSLKGQLITFLMTKFRNLALKADMQMSLILDYEDLNQPIIIRNQTELPLPMLSNQNGEADYNIWYHVKNTLTQTSW